MAMIHMVTGIALNMSQGDSRRRDMDDDDLDLLEQAAKIANEHSHLHRLFRRAPRRDDNR